MLDLLIIRGYVITMQGEGVGIIEDGAVGIRGNKITQVGKTEDIVNCQARRVINAANMAVKPGLIDAHIHTRISVLRGVSPDITNWMTDGLWHFENKLRQYPEIAL